MTHFMTRRGFGAALAGLAATAALPARALTTAEAQQLVQSAVNDINAVIARGGGGAQMFQQFEAIFRRYADLPTIARSALGPEARSASAAQLRAFTDAFAGYIGRKYGRRFNEFVGGEVVVQDARPLQSFYEVRATANLRGQAPFAVSFLVSDRSGANKFFDLYVEGISLLKSERTEIQALLDARAGDIEQLTADLRRLG